MEDDFTEDGTLSVQKKEIKYMCNYNFLNKTISSSEVFPDI